jgi:hypothetical protein
MIRAGIGLEMGNCSGLAGWNHMSNRTNFSKISKKTAKKGQTLWQSNF